MGLEFKNISHDNINSALDIYNWYVLNSIATFHLEPVSKKELARMVSIGNEKYRSYLILLDGTICGFCYLSQFRYKEAYDRTAEITLYLNQNFVGEGIGKNSVSYLEEVAKKNEINNLVAVITAGNIASIKLFEKAGYFKVGHLKNIGEKFGETLDVVSYQKQI